MYYAKQISPEYQESSFYLFPDEYYNEEYIIAGNKEYKTFATVKWDVMQDYIPEIENNIILEANDGEIIETVKEYFTEIENETALKIGKRIIEKVKTDIIKGYYSDEYKYYTDIYSLLTNTKYEYTTIHGICQGDWNILFYPSNYTKEEIHIIETEYFNTGVEYMVHDEEEEPEEPEEISGYCVYCHNYSNEENKKELCSIIGCKPNELKVYNIANEYKITKYNYTEV